MVRSNTDAHGHQILNAEKVPALHAAVVRACGDADGFIIDPRRCGFRPGSIRCAAGTDADSCLTPSQVKAVRSFYRGPTDRHGRSLYNGGEPYGSELGWPGGSVQPRSDAVAPGDTQMAALRAEWDRRADGSVTDGQRRDGDDDRSSCSASRSCPWWLPCSLRC